MGKSMSATFVEAIFAVTLVLGLAMPALGADSYKVDPAHTYILFKVKHLDVGYSYGRFNQPSGQFAFDDNDPTKSSIMMEVEAKNVDTDVDKRDNHLRSPDFFDVEKHPRITFKSTAVKKMNDGNYEVTGDLTLLGVTRPVTVQAMDTGSGKDPWGNYRRGFESTFTIKRSVFGMEFMMGGVSDDVEITVSVEGIRE